MAEMQPQPPQPGPQPAPMQQDQPVMPPVAPQTAATRRITDAAAIFDLGKKTGELTSSLDRIDRFLANPPPDKSVAALYEKAGGIWKAPREDAAKILSDLEKSLKSGTLTQGEADTALKKVKDLLATPDVVVAALELARHQVQSAALAQNALPVPDGGQPTIIVNAQMLLQQQALGAIFDTLDKPEALEKMLQSVNPEFKLGNPERMREAAAYGKELLARSAQLPNGARPMYFYDSDYYSQQLALNLILDVMKDPAKAEGVLKPLLGDRFKGFKHDPKQPLGFQLQDWMMREMGQTPPDRTKQPGQTPKANPNPLKIPPEKNSPGIVRDPDLKPKK